MKYKLEKIPEKIRKINLTYMMQRGNHKPASDPENAPTLLKSYQKEVDYGWIMPVTVECVP